ncbi:MAG TPA: hypothetical protein VFB13_18115 [Reyranella sp.]|jgi:hypothetical protein|nr:hypothetical protein [Reyranella sp.]
MKKALPLLLLLALPTSVGGQTGTIRGWFATPDGSCKVWLVAEHSVAVSEIRGQCANGLVQGPAEVRARFTEAATAGFTIDGTFRDGRLEGHGRQVWTSGRRTEGEWKAGLLNGKAVLDDFNGQEHFEGEFRDGMQNGHGTEHRAVGPVVRDYTGEWRNGDKEGRGSLTMSKPGCATHVRYDGEWKRGSFSGAGTLTLPDGSRKTGRWNGNALEMGDDRVSYSFIRLEDLLRRACGG